MVSSFEISQDSHSSKISWRAFLLLTFQSLGAIYGDIGTSPLYAMQAMFMTFEGAPSEQDIIGGVSLVLWVLLYLVCFKYCCFILRLHNGGEGGIFALYSILTSSKRSPQIVRNCALAMAIVGAAFVVSDGGLTPAVSILSAVEGLQAFSPNITNSVVVGVTVAIVAMLFLAQRFGTAAVSSLFAPITSVWFLTIAVFGIINIAGNGGRIFMAFNPAEGIAFLVRKGPAGFLCMGSVFLAVTGLEAMYADIGHFGLHSVRAGWLCVVFPAVALQYLGQGAVLLNNPSLYTNVFYASVPGYHNDDQVTGTYIYAVIIATLATIIASQAMITGAFSLASHAVSLNFLPPIPIIHTSKKVRGRIYIPVVCYFLMFLTIAIVVGFGHSEEITNAYGVTVCTDMVFTALLYGLVMHFVMQRKWYLTVLFGLAFLPLDSVFLAANYEKVPDRGYVPLITGTVLSSIMLTWIYGEKVRQRSTANGVVPLSKSEFANLMERVDVVGAEEKKDISRLSSSEQLVPVEEPPVQLLARVPGVGVFLCSDPESKFIPSAMVHMMQCVQTSPQFVVFCYVRVLGEPFVAPTDRLVIEQHSSNVFSVFGQYGYAEADQRDVVCLLRSIPPDHILAKVLGISSSRKDTIEVVVTDSSSELKSPLPSSPVWKGLPKTTFYACEEQLVVPSKGNWLLQKALYLYLFLKHTTGSRYDRSIPLGQLLVVSNVIELAS